MTKDLFHSPLNADDLEAVLAGLMGTKLEWTEAQDRAQAARSKGRAALVAAIEDWHKSHG